MNTSRNIILPEDDDSNAFISLINYTIDNIIHEYDVKEIVYVKIENWFDHKWLNYSGNSVIKFDFGGLEALQRDAALQPEWREKISIPPFNPNRVVYSKYYLTKATGNIKIKKSINKYRSSNDNIHNRIENYISDGIAIWFSSNSKELQKGSLMIYRIQDNKVTTWYATIENNNGCKFSKAKGIDLGKLKNYVEKNEY